MFTQSYQYIGKPKGKARPFINDNCCYAFWFIKKDHKKNTYSVVWNDLLITLFREQLYGICFYTGFITYLIFSLYFRFETFKGQFKSARAFGIFLAVFGYFCISRHFSVRHIHTKISYKSGYLCIIMET